jgi:glutamine cyclotransferase
LTHNGEAADHERRQPLLVFPETLMIYTFIRQVEVTYQGQPVERLNELEYYPR